VHFLCYVHGSLYAQWFFREEEQFLVKVIKYLLGLCDQAKGKVNIASILFLVNFHCYFVFSQSNKAVVASNIMYVVGQYPRFLKAHWNFLSVVVKKLFEFMHESHEVILSFDIVFTCSFLYVVGCPGHEL
jgi:exportin-1